jgi:hypothetical protein
MSPLSNDPDARERQLQNLKQGPTGKSRTSWKPGATTHLVHGLRSRNPPPVIKDPIVAELREALSAQAPFRDVADPSRADPADAWLLDLTAIGILQVRRCAAFIDLMGEQDAQGNLRPEVEGLSRAVESCAKLLDRLGLSPTSRAKLGLDVLRGAREAQAIERDDAWLVLSPEANELGHDALREIVAGQARRAQSIEGTETEGADDDA